LGREDDVEDHDGLGFQILISEIEHGEEVTTLMTLWEE
jgi:hypothetical protein